MLDVQRYWEVVLFSCITGNSDMHCKNFSLIDSGNGEYVLAPAYDLLAVLLADPADTEEMAMSFTVGDNSEVPLISWRSAWYLAACWPRNGTWHN
jgi:serine/threonine-protein kinase HipA